ncbi:MAG: class I SAM-dependent methyltransferase [candidate division WOR-3 bacterium]
MNCRACNSNNLLFYFSSKGQLGVNGNYDFYICKDCKSLNLKANFKLEEILNFYNENYPLFDIKKTWGKYYKFVEFEMRNVIRRREKFIKRFISLENKKVLDIGCGDGKFLEFLKKQYNCYVVGVDIVKLNENIKIYNNIDEIDESFDIITLWHYIEHDENPIKTIEKCYNLLNKSGIMIIETPKYPSIGFKIFKNNWAGLHTPRHFIIFSKEGLFSLVKNFKIIHYGSFTSFDKFLLYGLTILKPEEKNFITWTILSLTFRPFLLFFNDIHTIVVKKYV